MMPNPINISFRGMDSSAAVEDKIREGAAKLDTVYERISRCDVIVEAPHRRHRKGQQYHVRVLLTLPGSQLVVSRDPGPNEAHEDIFVAIRDAFHAARRQLEDHVRRHLRNKVPSHETPTHGRVTYLDAEGEWGYLEAEDGHLVYFHCNSVLGGMEKVTQGDEVRFVETMGEEGPQASTVTPIGAHGHHELPPSGEPAGKGL